MITRLAPSPTGALHLGNARTFLLTWLHARHAGGTILLRIDDLDGPRTKKGREQQAIEDLAWLGLDWDRPEETLRQSERAAAYDDAIDRLLDAGLAYPCICTRSEIAGAASAPHGPEGPRYPGTCRGRFATPEEAASATGLAPALRFAAPDGDVTFVDRLFDTQTFSPAAETGDFPIRKRDGTAAYQLATVVDDAATNVDLVIRGADLLPSTARQIQLIDALALTRPDYLHLPLVVGPDGRRLAKRHGDTRLAALRDAGWTAERTVGWLAATAGLSAPGEPVTAEALVGRYDPGALTTETVVVDPQRLGLDAPRL